MSSLESLDMFAGEESPRSFNSLDQCINASRAEELYSISDIIRGQHKQKAKRQKTKNLRPVATILFNS